MKSKQVTVFDKAMIAAVQEAIKPAHVDAKALIIVSPEHYWEVVNERLRASRSEVIEECAKVADETAKSLRVYRDHFYVADHVEAVAADIRKLKEPPHG